MAGGGKFDDARGSLEPTARQGVESDGQDPETLRLLAEELLVGTEWRETGKVRVQVVTRQREEDVEVPLARETVEVERVPINRPIDAMPAVREEDGVTIMPVVEEVVTIHRQLMLKEELHVRRVHATEVHRERVTLRRQEAVVTRTPTAEQNPTGG
ncbi:MAG TPA: YsnF/AvaK domain-containing protein [Phenylobacterium sp.]|jgi:uncharacterized protein (TIGR02271 family)